MAVENRIPKITLGEDAKEDLKNRLNLMIEEAEEFREASLFSDLHNEYWRLHLAEPRHKRRKTPWDGASNLCLPLTQAADLAIVANEYDAMLANDPVLEVVPTVSPDNAAVEEALSLAEAETAYWDFFYREVIPIRFLGNDALLDNTVDGTCSIKARMNRDIVVRRDQEIEERPVTESVTADVMGLEVRSETQTGMTQRIVERAYIERLDEISNETVDLERIYPAPGSGPSLQWPECRWYYQVQELDWSDLLERRRAGYDIPDSLKADLTESEPTTKEEQLAKKGGTGDKRKKTLRVCEFYMRHPLPARYQSEVVGVDDVSQTDDKDGYAEEVIVTYAPASRHLMRVVPLARVYPDCKRPHILGHYHRFPRYVYGMGVPAKLMHLNAAANAFWNQGVDQGSIATMPFGFYNPGAMGVMPELFSMKPGSLIPTPDPRGVTFPRMQFDPNFFALSNQQIQAWVERVTSVTDQNVGRQGTNSPKTARGTIALLQQGRIIFGILVAMHSEMFIELFRRNRALKRRYGREESAYRAFDKAAGVYRRKTLPKRAFEAEADFRFVINPSRQEELQKSQILLQLFMSAITTAVSNPVLVQPIRSALAKVYEEAGRKDFNKLWPEDLGAKVVIMQQQAAAAQQQQQMAQQAGMPPGGAPPMAGPPMAGNPPMPPVGMMPSALPPGVGSEIEDIMREPVPEITPEEESVVL